MPNALALTVPEAGFVLGQPIKALNQAIDRGEVSNVAKSGPGAKASRSATPFAGSKNRGKAAKAFVQKARVGARRLGKAELRYLALAAELHKDLTPAGRRRIYRAIKQLAPREQSLRLGTLAVELRPVDSALDAKLGRLAELKANVDEPKVGEPLLKGTQVSVYQVAALVKGQSMAEILEDYPGLTEDQVRTAADFAQAYPKAGRPYPKKSLKRALAELAGTGLFGLDTSDMPVTAQSFE